MLEPRRAANGLAAKRGALDGLSELLTAITDGLRGQSGAARRVGHLAERAERLAAQAWELGRARYSGGTKARDLAASVATFIDDAAALTQNAAREAAATHELAAVLADEAAELRVAVLSLDGVNDKAVVRTRLLPMLNTLAALPARLKGMTEVAGDVAGLGERARDLADFTERLEDNTWSSGGAAVAMYRELRDFADTAGAIFAEISADEARIRQSIAGMQEQATRLRGPAVGRAALGPIADLAWTELPKRGR